MYCNVLYTLFKIIDQKFISFTDLLQNFPDFEKLVHPAVLAISVKESLFQRAEDVDAECIQCAIKVVVLMPDLSRVYTTQ